MIITRETIQEIIELAKIQNNTYNLYRHKYCPDDIINYGQEGYESSPEFLEYKKASEKLDQYIFSLGYEKVLDIEALMFIGRGDDSDFQICRDSLAKTYPNPDGINIAVDYITSKIPLPDYLENALRMI